MKKKLENWSIFDEKMYKNYAIFWPPGSIVVTLAMLLRLMNCRFIIIHTSLCISDKICPYTLKLSKSVMSKKKV